jgi:CTP:molybdopterin cytidylyltransferase MocA
VSAPATAGRDPATALIVLAAGAGSRFGAPKQLAPVGGRPMLARLLDELHGIGSPQILVLGCHAELVAEAVPAPTWRTVLAADWQLGPGASLRAGLAAAADAEQVLIVLGDLPWLRRAAVDRVLGAAAVTKAEALRGFEAEVPGHPVLLRGGALRTARAAAPAQGMGSLLGGEGVLPVPCAGLGVARDVDLPSDLTD